MSDNEAETLLAELLDVYIDAVHQGAGSDPDDPDFDHMFISAWEDAPDMIKRVREWLNGR